MCTWNCSPLRLLSSENTCEMVRGMSPRSAYRSGPPVIVNVFPDPVCPYAKMVPFTPASAWFSTPRATRSNTSSCFASGPMIPLNLNE